MKKFLIEITAEQAAGQAIALTSAIAVGQATERSDKMAYKWADKDDDAQISVKAALASDRMCLKERGVSPFAELFAMNAASVEASTPPPGVVSATMKLQAAVGLFAAKLSDGECDIANMSARMRADLPKALAEIKKRVSDLEHSISAPAADTREAV